jgi:hypothetical protein
MVPTHQPAGWAPLCGVIQKTLHLDSSSPAALQGAESGEFLEE